MPKAARSQDETGTTIDACAALDTHMTGIEPPSLAKASQALNQERQARLGSLFWIMRGLFKTKTGTTPGW